MVASERERVIVRVKGMNMVDMIRRKMRFEMYTSPQPSDKNRLRKLFRRQNSKQTRGLV